MRRHQHSSNRVERALGRTLVRQPPPAGMTERIMAGMQSDGVRVVATAKTDSWLRWPSLRITGAIAGCACAAALLLTVGLPFREANRKVDQVVLQGAELELAEVLHLAGNKWNQAREAALSPGRDEDYD